MERNAPDAASPMVINQLLTGFWVSQAVHAAAKLGIPDCLQAGPASVETVAAKLGTHPQATHRLMRALSSVGIFREIEPNRYAVTPLGALLTSAHPQSMRSLAIMIGEVGWDAWGNLSESVRTGATAFSSTHGKEIFPYLTEHPEKARIFNEAMSGYVAAAAQALPAAYDFRRHKRVVDVGGGHGFLLGGILNAASETKGVLFDLPQVVAGAAPVLERAGVAGRCEVVGGDFFASVPAGGDAYVMASIIHDWDDERSLAILRNVRSAIAKDGKLLLAESVIPANDEPSFGKWMDLQMLVVFGGRERTEAEYQALLAAAGFRLDRVTPMQAAPSLIEASPI